jgi:hypothetical protein
VYFVMVYYDLILQFIYLGAYHGIRAISAVIFSHLRLRLSNLFKGNYS